MAGSLASRTITVPSIVNYYTDSELNSEYHAKTEYEQAIKKYGAIYKILDLNNAGMNEAELQTFAREWIRKHYFDGVLAFTVKGIDLHLLGYNKDKLCVGDRIPVEFLDVYKTPVTKILTCISAQYDLLNPGNSTYKIGIPDVSMDVKIPNKNRNGGVGKKSSSYSSSNSSGGAALYEYYKEIDTKAQINADEIELLANRIVANTDDLTLTSQIADINTDNLNIVSTAVAGIQESAVIQNGTEIVHVVGAFNVKDDYYGDWPLWDPTYKYKAGAKVRYGNKGYILLHDIPESVDIDINNPIYWEEQHGRKGIELIDGAAMELDNINGQRVSIGTKISSYDETIDKFEGSALWTQRDNITGVCGEYDVYTDPLTGKKTLIIKSGGGVKIRRDNTEFGIYDEDNLKGGILVKKINMSSWGDWVSGADYTVGAKVYHNGDGWICKTAHHSGETFDPSKWERYVETRTTISGDVVEIQSKDGTYISASNAINSHTDEINGVNREVTSMEGSDFWVNRNHILGVCGEYDVIEEPPGSGNKILVITSGGGIKIRKNDTEFGLYDEDSLKGGIIVNKINSAGWDEWTDNKTYHVGDKVNHNGDGWICKTEHTVLSGEDFDPTKWTKYVATRTKIVGDVVEIQSKDGTYISASNAINSHTDEINGVKREVTSMEGSDFWVNQNHILGVCGEYDVIEEPPGSGNKTLVITSGGGIKIRKNNTEFGIYDEDSLTGGILVDKVNTSGWGAWVSGAEYPVGAKVTHNGDGWICNTAHRSGDTFDSSKWTKYHATNTKIIGDVVDIDASQIHIGSTTNVQEWMNTTDIWKDDTDMEIDDFHGFMADQGIVNNLYANKFTAVDGEISNIKADYVKTTSLSSKIALISELAVQDLHGNKLIGTDLLLTYHEPTTGHDVRTSVKTFIKEIQVVPSSTQSNAYILQYKTYNDTEWQDASTFEHAVTVTGNWNGESSTVPVPYYEVLGSSNELKTYVYLEIETGGYSVSPNTKINAKIYHDSTASANQLITKELTLEENVNGKYVELYTGSKQASPPTNVQKGYISTTNTYNSGWNSARSYVVDNLPTASIGSYIDSTYNKISIKYPGSNGSSTLSSQDYTLSLNDSFKPALSTTTIHAVELKTNSNVVARISGQVFYTDGWDKGWDDARDKVSAPYTAATGSTITIKGPNSARTGQETVRTYGLMANPDNENNSVVLYTSVDGSNVTVARFNHNKYTSGKTQGWTDAYGKVAIPTSNTSTNAATFKTPNEASTSNPVQNTHSLSIGNNGNDAVNLNMATNSGTAITIAKFTHNKYTSGKTQGWTDAYGKVVIPGSNTTKNSATFKTPNSASTSNPVQNVHVLTIGNNGNDAVNLYRATDEGTGVTIATFSHNKYTSGKTQGWTDAYGKVAIPTSNTSTNAATFKTPNEASTSNPVQNTHSLSIGNNGNDAVNLNMATNSGTAITIAKFTHNKYTSGKTQGWTDAYGKVAIPTSNTSTNAATFKTPNSASTSNPAQNTHSLSMANSGNNAVNLNMATNSGTAITIAKFTHNKYTSGKTQGWTDAYGKVSVPTSNTSTNAATFKTPNEASTSNPAQNTHGLSMANSGNDAVNLNMATNSGTAITIAKFTHNKYTTGYRAGSQAVGWSTSWSSGTPYTDGNHNKLTVATTGRVDGSGNDDNHTGSWDIYVTSGNNVAYARLASASGTIIAQVSHNKYTIGYRAGSQAVGWSTSWSNGTPYTDGNHNKLTVATTGRVDDSGAADNHSGAWDVYVTSANDVAYARLASASGTIIAQVTHNKYTSGKTQGWTDAYGKVAIPTSNTSTNAATFKTPNSASTSNPAQNTHSLSMANSGNDAVNLNMATNSGTAITIATFSHNKYTAGQTAAGVELDATNHKIKRALSSSTKEYTVSMYTGNAWSNGKRTIEARVGSTAINSAEITAPSATITFDCTDLGDPSRTASGQNDNSITATAKHGTYSLGTGTQVIHMTEGNWNAGYKAVNCRLTDSSGKLLDRLWIEAPAPSVSTKTSSSGTYKGTFSRPAAGSYLTISCGGNTYSWLVQ